MPRHGDDERPRGVFLSVLLGAMTVSAGMLVLFLLCGFLSLHVLGIVSGIVLVGYLHYLLWGQGLDEQVAAESDPIDIAALADELKRRGDDSHSTNGH